MQRLQYSKAQVFSDSLNAINMIMGELQTSPQVHHWVLQIQDMCSHFSYLNFFHVPRIRNRNADLLAKDVLEKSRSMLWLSDFPIWLSPVGFSTRCKCKMYSVCSC